MTKPRTFRRALPPGGIKVIVYGCRHTYVLRWLDPVDALCPECGRGKLGQIE